ncbi:glycosyltransferase family A protein [Methylocaldum sp.]|uniref:glycosyltransferase family 2 protein n=1 Tax=Methylocaldum sp. TaxID=1969727 RepID=UPI002D6686D0|nr:glycosyltransferase family A protein [Methylocaldum sp.]HYE35251.1 glycosyltransferase family A protein [Methylocaldum sp.]
MSTDPLVSGIVIFLNAEQYIEEAIASVFAQTHRDWELLLVDDGSTDRSTAIAKRYAQEYSGRIRYIEHEGHANRGMSASRNLGIRHASGQYIGFLDADDVWLPDKLEEQLAIFARFPRAGMVYGWTLIWHSWTKRLEDQELDRFYDLGVEPDTLVPPPKLLPQLLENKAQTPTTCNALLRADVFKEIGGFEESFRGMYEDQVFFAKVHLNTPVYVADRCWAKYRQHADSCSAGDEDLNRYYESRRPFLSWVESYVRHSGCRDVEVWRVIRRELWTCEHPFLSARVERCRAALSGIRNSFRL